MESLTNPRAAVFAGSPGQLQLEHFERRPPRGGEVLVRVLGCTLCGSDIHTFEGRRTVPTPTVLGHEIVGEIVAWGPEAPQADLAGSPLRPGDRITWGIVAACGDCYYCRRDLPQKCLRALKYGHEPVRPGDELTGGLAEVCCLAPGTPLLRLPEALPLAVACPANCATATVAAAVEAAGAVPQRSFAVIGAGLLGLTACAMLRVLGAAEVVACEPDPTRRERARAFGAHRTTDPLEFASDVPLSAEPHGFDAILECSGTTPTVEHALPRLRMGGTLVLIGAVFPGPAAAIVPERLVRRQLTLRGIHNYAPRHLLSAVRFLEQAHATYPFAELVAAWYPLTEAQAAFTHAAQGTAIRVGVRP